MRHLVGVVFVAAIIAGCATAPGPELHPDDQAVVDAWQEAQRCESNVTVYVQNNAGLDVRVNIGGRKFLQAINAGAQEEFTVARSYVHTNRRIAVWVARGGRYRQNVIDMPHVGCDEMTIEVGPGLITHAYGAAPMRKR